MLSAPPQFPMSADSSAPTACSAAANSSTKRIDFGSEAPTSMSRLSAIADRQAVSLMLTQTAAEGRGMDQGVVALTAVVLVLLQLGHGAVDKMRAGSVASKHLPHRRAAARVICVDQRELTAQQQHRNIGIG